MLGVVYIFLAGLLWAVDTLIRYPLLGTGVSALKVVFLEHLFLSALFLPYLLRDFAKIGEVKVSTIFYFIVIGALGSGIGTLSFTEALTLINPTLVILLQKLQPVVAVTFAYFFLGEKVKNIFFFWAALALLGSVFISAPDFVDQHLSFGELLNHKAFMGYFLTLVAVVSWGTATVFGKKASLLGLNEWQIMGWRFVFGLFGIALYSFTLRSQLISFSFEGGLYLKILLMILLSGIGALFFYYRGLKKISARATALAELFFPFSAVFLNWVFLDAKLLPIQMVGGGLVALSSLVIQLKKY